MTTHLTWLEPGQAHLTWLEDKPLTHKLKLANISWLLVQEQLPPMHSDQPYQKQHLKNDNMSV